jgi:hypothetical protein
VEIEKHFEKLGFSGKDKVTGIEGVIDSICFDLYGCIQVSLRPPVAKDGDLKDGRWFDVSRIEVTGKKRVMEPPNFEYGAVAEGLHGPADKPCRTDSKV